MKKPFALTTVLAAVALCLAGPLPVHAGSLLGGLYVKTTPEGAAVSVGGELKGVSPCGIADVGIGEIKVTATRVGYEKTEKTVEVKPDEIAMVELTMKPLGKVGHLTILVEPAGSKVELDRVPRGRTPMRVINLQPGTHSVKVSRDGYRSMHTSAKIISGQENSITGKLRKGKDPLRSTTAGEGELPAKGKLAYKEIPSVDQMPEERAFEPVRQLIAERQYGKALKTLKQMSEGEENRKYVGRVTRDRRFVNRLQELMKAAGQELNASQGEKMELKLRKGITLEGKVTKVTEDTVSLDLTGNSRTKEVSLAKIDAAMIIELASESMDPSKPSNQSSFALLHAAEGEIEDAIEAAAKAAEKGKSDPEVNDYIRTEKLWAAARDKARQESAKRVQMAAMQQQQRRTQRPPRPEPPRVVIDTQRGGGLPAPLLQRMKATGMEVQMAREGISGTELRRGTVLVFRQNAGRIRPFGRREVQRLIDFVRRGGAIFVVGAPRPAAGGGRNPFNDILGPLGVQIRNDQLEKDEDAPDEYPANLFIAYPAGPHPVTNGAGPVAFQPPVSSLGLRHPSLGLLRTDPFVGTPQAGPAPWLAAAGQVGRGKFVVFSSAPQFTNPRVENLIFNAVRWAGTPRR